MRFSVNTVRSLRHEPRRAPGIELLRKSWPVTGITCSGNWNCTPQLELFSHYLAGLLPAVWRCAHPGCTHEIAALTVST